MPIKSLVLKVSSRCNLNCSYCYMYNLGDKTYKDQPKVMSKETVDQLLIAVYQHTQKHSLKRFQFIFHGGEPLLATLSWYKYFVAQSFRILHNIQLQFTLQTNGVLYDEKWGNGLQYLGIRVGFSWDGPQMIHDKFRIYHNGTGSYTDVIQGMQIHKSITGSLFGLSVINAEIDTREYYQNVKSLGLTNFTLLLPQLHHSMKNEFKYFKYSSQEQTFGKWLCKLFDIWWYDLDENKPEIQYFKDFISMIMGESKSHESFGNEENTVLVIETNGDIESSTSLKSCGNGFTKEGNNISNMTIDMALESKLIKLFLNSHRQLPHVCSNCAIKEVCGAGRINERFSEENGFDNPSVYCNDIKRIITHIQNRLFENFSEVELADLNLTLLKYEEI